MNANAIRTSVITVEELALAIDRCVVVDCRHELTKPDAGRLAYQAGHIPSAVFLHQDEDLASPRDGTNGRHPLPDRQKLLQRLREIGLSDGQQLVAYDASGGMTASRLWWLSRWLGHPEVAVLDGGISAWTRAGYPLTKGQPEAGPQGENDSGAARRPAGNLSDRAPLGPSVLAAQLLRNIDDKQLLVVDARAGERVRGEVEPMDPVAGHIPGAINRPQSQNLRPDGMFKPAEVLAAEFKQLLGDRPVDTIVHSCGSGISACHNLLAMEYAGLSGSALYPGSWSEWVADKTRPVATGA